MILTDLRELKSLLDIDPADSSEDKNLNFWVEQASNIIEEWLNRDFTFKTRTQYYQGTGTQKLLLRNRPVYPNPPAGYTTLTVYVDEAGYWDEPTGTPGPFSDPALTYGNDYALWIDQDDGSSRSGILIRRNSFWNVPNVRQQGLLAPFLGDAFGNIKVTYTAGYTVDTLPAAFRFACNQLVAKLRYMFPLGLMLNSESYEERSISIMNQKDFFFGMIKPILSGYRNWSWGGQH